MRNQLPLALLLASSTFACVDNACTGADDPTKSTSALELENGGFDTPTRLPMFGDQPRTRPPRIEADAAVVDAMASDPTVTAIENQAGGARHRVLIAWGRMPADPNATTGRNWSGALTRVARRARRRPHDRLRGGDRSRAAAPDAATASTSNR